MRSFLLILVFLFTGAAVFSQELTADDMALVRDQDFHAATGSKKYSRSGNDTRILQAKHGSALAQYNPLSLVLKGTMALYQQVLSPQLSRSCPYEITCSNFSKHAIREFGVLKGIFLSADRVLRCNRIGLLDVHPLNINDNNGTIADPLEQYRSR